MGGKYLTLDCFDSGLNALKLMEMEVLQRGQCFMISMRKRGRVHGMIISADLSQICFL